MPNTREKLIKLLEEDPCVCLAWDCVGDCKYAKLENCFAERYADHLIANGVTVQKWIPVTERLPEEDGRYLVVKKIFNNSIWQDVLEFAKDGRKVDKYDFHREWKNVWYLYDSEWGHIITDNVTHWMPLPEPPKENG